MVLDYIKELYAFNWWANARVLDAASKLTSEAFTKDLRNSFRSVRDTLVHIMSAEWIWLQRWNGTSPKAMLAAEDFPTLADIKTLWAEVEHEQAEFLPRVSEESLAKVIAYVNTKGESFAYPLWQMMCHVVNHSTYHRGQITTMLRQLGFEPAATDFLLFYDMKSDNKK